MGTQVEKREAPRLFRGTIPTTGRTEIHLILEQEYGLYRFRGAQGFLDLGSESEAVPQIMDERNHSLHELFMRLQLDEQAAVADFTAKQVVDAKQAAEKIRKELLQR